MKRNIYEAICHDGKGIFTIQIGKDTLFDFSVCKKSNRIHLVGGLRKHPYAHRPWRAIFDNTSKHLISDMKYTINKTVLRAKLVLDKINITAKSRYIDEMPYRSKPLCFELNNSLYIAGHVPYNENILIGDHLNHFDKDDCKFCDRFDLLNEKYHRNVHFMPYSLKRVIQPKIVIDKHEAFAVISFYDPLDFQDKIWTFTEDEGFVEQPDLATYTCKGCKIGADQQKSYSGNFFSSGDSRYDLHHSYCNLTRRPLPLEKQILRIK